MLDPRPVDWGGGHSPVLAVRYATRVGGRCGGPRTTPVDPPPDVAENIKNMIIRRICNKS